MSSDTTDPGYDEATTAKIESLKAELASLEQDTQDKLEEMAAMGLEMHPAALQEILEAHSSAVFMEYVLGDENSVTRHEFHVKVQTRFRDQWLLPAFNERDEIKSEIKNRQARAALTQGILPPEPGQGDPRYTERTGVVPPHLIKDKG